MKLKKLFSLLKEKKRVIILEKQMHSGVVLQYLSDGVAAYPIFGLPRLRKESLLRLMDVEESEWNKWHVSILDVAKTKLSLSDTDEREERIFGCAYPIETTEGTVLCFSTENNGILFLNEKYLGPISDTVEKEFYRRKHGDMEYIVVKHGLMLDAAIMPMQMICEAFVDTWREFLARCVAEQIRKIIPRSSLIESSDEEKPEGEQMEL